MLNILRKSMSVSASLLFVLACTGCASNGPVRGAAVATGFAAKDTSSADFVAQSRAAQLDYKPVGVKPPERDHAPLNKEELDELKGALEVRRASNEAEAAAARSLSKTPMAQPPVVHPVK